MAGYDYSEWKSNSAVEAEDNGLRTAGRVAKRLGVSRQALEDGLPPHERHHVSGAYTLVGYYDPGRITPEQLQRIRKADAKFHPHSLRRATVEWLDWPAMKVGRYRSGKAVRPTERRATGARVTFKTRATLCVVCSDGEEFTKRVTTGGLRVVDEIAGEVVLAN